MKSSRSHSCSSLCALLIGASVSAQDAAKNEESPAKPDAEATAAAPPTTAEPVKSAVSVQVNFDWTSAYYYHGIVQEDTGLILQPAAKVTVNLFEQDDFKLDVFATSWNSFQSQETGSTTTTDFVKYWYESDIVAGFAITKGKFSFTTNYTFLTSPNGAYQTVEELDLTFGFDDGEVLGAFALHPYALIAFETNANGSDGAGTNGGAYLELGVAPGFSIDCGKTQIPISFPVTVGLSLDDYYENAAGQNDTFGFVQVGVKTSIPLPFGERFGKWSLNAGVYGLFLGDNTAGYNGGRHDQVIGTVGLQWNF